MGDTSSPSAKGFCSETGDQHPCKLGDGGFSGKVRKKIEAISVLIAGASVVIKVGEGSFLKKSRGGKGRLREAGKMRRNGTRHADT